MNLPATDLLFFVVIAILAISLIAVLIAFFQQNKKLLASDREKLAIQNTMQQKSLQLLDEARDKAIRIILQAQDKAQEILKQAITVQNQTNLTFQSSASSLSQNQISELKKVSGDLVKAYQESLQKLKDDDINLFKNISKYIESDITTGMQGFKKVLEEETTASQKIVQEKIQEQYENTQREIEVYKQEQMKKIQESIYPLLKHVTERVLGDSLTFDQQQNLVIKALEEAKAKHELIL